MHTNIYIIHLNIARAWHIVFRSRHHTTSLQFVIVVFIAARKSNGLFPQSFSGHRSTETHITSTPPRHPHSRVVLSYSNPEKETEREKERQRQSKTNRIFGFLLFFWPPSKTQTNFAYRAPVARRTKAYGRVIRTLHARNNARLNDGEGTPYVDGRCVTVVDYHRLFGVRRSRLVIHIYKHKGDYID